MKMNIVGGDNNSNEYLESIVDSLSGHNNIVYGFKVILYASLLILGGYLVLLSLGIWKYVGYLLIGGMFAHGVELSHQALHGTGFRSSKLSHIVGFCMCMFMLVSYKSYQMCHLRHHAKIGTKEDTEFFEFNMIGKEVGVFYWLSSFFMLSAYTIFFQRVWRSFRKGKLFDFLTDHADKQCKVDYIKLIAVLLVCVFASVLMKSTVIVQLWIIPLVFIAGPLHTIIELPEHYGCNKLSKNIYENTRTIKGGKFVTWFVNGNNYHVEHHLYPRVRPEKSKQLNSLIVHNIKYLSNSYLLFIKEALLNSKNRQVITNE